MAEMKLVPYKVNETNADPSHIPYGVDQCQANQVWEDADYGEGIVVAVIDTGIDKNHHELAPHIIGGYNFVNDSDNFQDDNGHGTHCSGIILSVAPKAKILACKVLDQHGSGSYQNIIDGIRYAADWIGPNGEKVRILNLSLGGPDPTPELEQAILHAVSLGILICVASGNEGDNQEGTFEYGYPALYNESITVAACDFHKKLAPFSNNHLEVDFIAAGVNVFSTYLNNSYAYLSGTSMATPHIAGMFALVIKIGEDEFKRMLTESELYSLLVKCSCSLGYKKSSEGHGLPELTRIFANCV